MARVEGVQRRVSFTDLQQWPDDGRRYELYDGEVWVIPAPLPRHQRVAFKVSMVLDEYERATGGLMFVSPIDIVLSEHNVVQPDIVFFKKGRRQAIDMLAAIRIPPDLAVEVLSPGTVAIDRGRKMRLLARFGLPEYWLVDPIAQTVEIYVLTGDRLTLDHTCSPPGDVRSPTLTGFAFEAVRIFGE